MSKEDVLALWVVYERPSDYPHSYVVRRQCVRAGSIAIDAEPWGVFSTLHEARLSLPVGLFNLGRQPGDQPQIKEVWI